MIDRFRIQGFKSLVDTEIELGAVNVFIGANGSGKSNILEAFGVMSAIVSERIGRESLKYRGVRLGPPRSYLTAFSTAQTSRILLEARSGQSDYSVEVGPDPDDAETWKISNETIALNGTKLLIRGNDSLELFEIEGLVKKMLISENEFMNSCANFFNHIIEIYKNVINQPYPEEKPLETERRIAGYKEIQTLFHSIRSFGLYCPSTPQLRGAVEDVSRVPLGLGGSGLGRAIAEFMNVPEGKLGPYDIDDVYDLIEWADKITAEPLSFSGSAKPDQDNPVNLRFHDRFMRENVHFISVSDASEGALYILFILALAGHPKSPPLFAVDNFDQALHPRLARELTRIVCDQIVKDGNRQMLATTHNPLVLDGLNLLDDRIRLFAVDRDSKGATQVKRIEVTPELMARADEGHSLSRLWVMGRLGAMPHSL